jgi:hypothetical protein
MCINELEAFLEFQAKISVNNLLLGKNVVLWVHFHPASTVKVKVARRKFCGSSSNSAFPQQ